jgi:NhaP-type Na+/H+ or K+/H+ antiporter
VDPTAFGQFGPLFSHFVLIFILFESGTDLKFSEVKKSFGESAGITFFGFLITWITLTLCCYFFFDLSLLSSLFIGAALGGTSSAVVVGLVRKIHVQPKTATTLIMESAETDVFTLAIPLLILGLMTTGEISTNTVVPQFLASVLFSLLIGILGAFLWSFIINKFPDFKSTKFSTPAFLFILYGIVEYLHASSPLTALSFGIAIGNLKYLEPKIIEKVIPNQSIVLPENEKDFFAELVFLLRTFFFVFIGISIQIDRFDLLMWGALFTVMIYFARILMVKFVIGRNTPVLDKAVISIMIPKGLGAAVIATLPIQEGLVDGGIIQSICFSVILFSTIYCTVLFLLLKRGITMPFYKLIFRKSPETADSPEAQ